MAATALQITANRINAQLSTGPRTDAGKQASAANSTKHGLASGYSVLPHEDQDEYRELRQRYQDEYDPCCAREEYLLDQMVHACWRRARIQRLENCFLSIICGEEDICPYDKAILDSMKEQCVDVHASLERYAAAAERTFHRAHREIIATRDIASNREDKEIQNEAKIAQTKLNNLLTTPRERQWKQRETEALVNSQDEPDYQERVDDYLAKCEQLRA